MRRWFVYLAVAGGILLLISGIFWMRAWLSAPRDEKPSSAPVHEASTEVPPVSYTHLTLPTNREV